MPVSGSGHVRTIADQLLTGHYLERLKFAHNGEKQQFLAMLSPRLHTSYTMNHSAKASRNMVPLVFIRVNDNASLDDWDSAVPPIKVMQVSPVVPQLSKKRY